MGTPSLLVLVDYLELLADIRRTSSTVPRFASMECSNWRRDYLMLAESQLALAA
jgi:hypothetical protein